QEEEPNPFAPKLTQLPRTPVKNRSKSRSKSQLPEETPSQKQPECQANKQSKKSNSVTAFTALFKQTPREDPAEDIYIRPELDRLASALVTPAPPVRPAQVAEQEDEANPIDQALDRALQDF